MYGAPTVAALDSTVTKYERKVRIVEIDDLNTAGAERHERLTGQLPSR